jgi:hypothetical protein
MLRSLVIFLFSFGVQYATMFENKGVSIKIITTFITITLSSIIFESFLSYSEVSINMKIPAAYAQEPENGNSSSFSIHGGGTGSITCPDGSSNNAVLAFVVSGNQSVDRSKGIKISTSSWNINELPSDQNPNPGFVSGSFNIVNFNLSQYKISGQKVTESQFCEPPVSVPITLSGACGQNVGIAVQFESNNPILMTGGSFTGEVSCSR